MLRLRGKVCTYINTLFLIVDPTTTPLCQYLPLILSVTEPLHLAVHKRQLKPDTSSAATLSTHHLRTELCLYGPLLLLVQVLCAVNKCC